jgi:radical SAM superfamily enzyme YgiQ (UPF0313 family)
MKILLLNPITISGKKFIRMCRNHRVGAGDTDTWPPIDLAEIAAVLRREGFTRLKILDSMALGHTFKKMIAEIVSFAPDLMIVHNITPTVYDDKKMATMIKEKLPNIKIAFYGIPATARTHDILSHDIEFTIRNEPEYTSLELARYLVGSEKTGLESIKGLSYFKNGSPYDNPDRPLGQCLDELPLPARDLLDNKRYILLNKGVPFTIIRASRGCPYNCIFCTSSLYSMKCWRSRSPRNIITEIKSVRETLDIHDFMFLSDTFTLKEEVILALCEMIRKECSGISWICNSRTDTLTEKMAFAMKEAGCWLVSLGIESGDETILKNIKKGATVADAKKSVNILRKAGIRSIGYYVFGLPGETSETIEKTISFSKELDTDYAYFFPAIPFPGTEYFEIARREGRLLSQDWRRYYQGKSGIISFPDLDGSDIVRAIQRAFRTYYLRPSRIIKELREIRHTRDIFRYSRIGWKLITNSF